MASSYDRDMSTSALGTAVARAKEKPPTAITNVVGDPEREERMNRLRERYRSGTYHVDSRSIAARIVDEHIVD